MKPSHLVGLFEYLFMFWLQKHLPTKKALNSKLIAIWLASEASSIFFSQYRLGIHFLTFTWLKILRKKSPKFLQLFSEFGQNNFPYNTINNLIILSTRILFLYFQNIPKLSRRKIAWKYLSNDQKLPTETKYNFNHFRIFLLKKFFTLHCSRSDMQINGSCKSSWHDFTQKLKNPTKVQLLEVVVLLLEHLFIYEAYPKMRDRNLSLCIVNKNSKKITLSYNFVNQLIPYCTSILSFQSTMCVDLSLSPIALTK